MLTGELTFLLGRLARGERSAQAVVFERTFGRLRRIAAALLARERRSASINPTALVNEAYATRLHLLRVAPENREHFFGMAARAMRQVLVDRSRVRDALKNTPVPAPPKVARAEGCEELAVRLAAGQALRDLGRMDTVAAETIRLRFAEGYTVAEVAGIQGRDKWRVAADCEFGLRWLRKRLDAQSG